MKRPLVVFEDPLLFTCDKQQFGFEELMPQTKEPDVINATNGRLGVCRFFSKGYCIKVCDGHTFGALDLVLFFPFFFVPPHKPPTI